MKRMAAIPFLLVVMFLTGCHSVYYNPRYPVLEKPDRPKLENVPGTEMKKMSPEAQTAVAGNFDKLIKHVGKLEAAIDTYNGYANEQNAKLKTGEK